MSTRAASYVRSSLWRYLEEALAETVAQVGVTGFSKFFRGIRFPIENGYMYLMRRGGYNPAFGGHGLVKEAAALVYVGVVVGIPFEVRFEHTLSSVQGPWRVKLRALPMSTISTWRRFKFAKAK